MNVKSLLQLLLIVFVLASCEVPYEDNVRLLIKGMIVDNNQAPISDVEVSAYLRRDNNFIYSSGSSGSGGEFLGNDLSDSEGEFEIISLFGRANDFAVEIYNEGYSKYVYRTSLIDYEPKNLQIDLQTVSLRKLANLNLHVTRTSSSSSELTYSITYSQNYCREVYDEGEFVESESFCYAQNTISRHIEATETSSEVYVYSLLNSEIVFTYRIDDGPEQTQTILIDQPEYEFTFEF